MQTLIVGSGALGGMIASRLLAADKQVHIATRTMDTADLLRRSGLDLATRADRISATSPNIHSLAHYFAADTRFDLILLATKAPEALLLAPQLLPLLTRGGTLLPIQNGGISQLLSDELGPCILGGISNFGATMHAPGIYEQRNAGNLLIGELTGGPRRRTDQIRDFFFPAVEVRTTSNFRGAIWSKLLLNCTVTTLGAIAGHTMRQYILSPVAKRLFMRTYDETLAVALATGVRPEPMLVAPVPPGWNGRTTAGSEHDQWLTEIVAAYGDLKPSMLQDLERRRPTEINFINGYVADLARRHALPAPFNAAITETVHAIEHAECSPHPALLDRIFETVTGSVIRQMSEAPPR